MKVWCFYLKPWKVTSNLLLEFEGMFDEKFIELDGIRCPLYAFTNDKKLKDLFKETRNEKILFCIKYDMNEIEYKRFKAKFIELEINNFSFRCLNSKGEKTYAFIPTTFFESNSYEDSNEYADDILLAISSEQQTAIVKILKCLMKKYQKIIGVNDIITINDNIYSIMNGIPIELEIDGLHYLIKIFGELFKSEVR